MSHVCVGSPCLMSRRGLYSEVHSTMGNGYPVDRQTHLRENITLPHLFGGWELNQNSYPVGIEQGTIGLWNLLCFILMPSCLSQLCIARVASQMSLLWTNNKESKQNR